MLLVAGSTCVFNGRAQKWWIRRPFSFHSVFIRSPRGLHSVQPLNFKHLCQRFSWISRPETVAIRLIVLPYARAHSTGYRHFVVHHLDQIPLNKLRCLRTICLWTLCLRTMYLWMVCLQTVSLISVSKRYVPEQRLGLSESDDCGSDNSESDCTDGSQRETQT